MIYTLDPLGRRVAQDVTGSGVGGDTQYYHSANWQVLEEREYLGGSYQPHWQNVWSLAYMTPWRRETRWTPRRPGAWIPASAATASTP